MVSSSKILTVSYGTFSCTAEGFEDPLAVVKETTHFFRGVVREDRFFGAEPPQFDPELAAELLQSQISAEVGQGTLTLRNPLSGAAASSGAMSAALAAGRAPERPAAAVAEPAPAAAPEVSVAEEVAEMAAEPAPEEAKVAVSYQGDGSEDDALQAQMAEDTIAALLAEDLAEDLADEMPGDDSLAAEAEFFEAEEEVAAPQPGVGLSDPESVAAKLRRIRAVVAQGAPAEDDVEPEAETEKAEASVSAMLDALAPERDETPSSAQALRDNLFSDTLAGAEFDLSYEDDDAEDDEDALFDMPAAEADAAASEEAEAEAEDAEIAPVQEKAPLRLPRARVVKVKRAEFDAALGQGLIEEAEAAPAAPVSSLSPEDEDDLARELEAVRAELKGDFQEAFDEPEEIDAADADEADEVTSAIGQLMGADQDDDGWDDDEDEWEDEEPMSASDAADPLRLEPSDAARDWDDDSDSAVDFEFTDAFDDEQDEDDDAEEADDELVDQAEAEREEALRQAAHQEVRKAVKMSSPARAMLTERRVEDNDASRILDETNTQLQEPEGNRRRSAIAHLRAAVAATRADKLLGRKRDAREQTEPYRADLANVVRPRRPEAPASQTERPAEIVRPAPLKLVAEQRVDAEAPAPRPRRVRISDMEDAAALTGGEADDSFAEYAESVGARELPELLEAAAAYMSFVERREQFSRPQLMTKVRQVETEESSREDRLRSFGQLLREGKIEKTRGGRFTASERISFKPDARAAS
ncbi:hypothetical protein KUV62_10215 [Salipiger bermudensis]|uniref:hypothetical protein n=1 Tax=Salipiger bermudensis TaxID=344736 RepID=UPI001C991C9E|nr:hypothetical protein [Salipiger bermudensis]MBY6004284.1 hypothetical protein [Salipiger bermudensis]